MKTLIKNAQILEKKDNGYFVLNNNYLIIEDDVISYIGETIPKELSFDKVFDLPNHLLMPGLINCHCHSAMTLLRGVGTGLSFNDWLNKAIIPVEDKMDPSDIKSGTEMAMLEMLSTGTTSFVDMYDFPFAEAEVIAKSGLVCNLGRAGVCFDQNLSMDRCDRYQECINFIKAFNQLDFDKSEMNKELHCDALPQYILDAICNETLRADLILHSEYLSTENMVNAFSEFNKKFRANIQIHVSETLQEHNDCIEKHGLTPIQYFNHLGILDYNVLAAHCVHVSEEDLRIMSSKKTNLIYNPVSNMKLASGMAPISKAVRIGINVALGTDGCASNDNLDMFKEMHTAALLSAIQSNDPSAVKAADVLDFATINGAKAIRRKSGILKEGYKADIIAIDMTKPHLSSYQDIASLLVYSAKGSDVTHTFVNGKILYEDGIFHTLDVKTIFTNFNNSLIKLGLK